MKGTDTHVRLDKFFFAALLLPSRFFFSSSFRSQIVVVGNSIGGSGVTVLDFIGFFVLIPSFSDRILAIQGSRMASRLY
ncbi:hypothetical protein SDJN03_09600, partial [Cucurbita argyrosperma subsp. sororia]